MLPQPPLRRDCYKKPLLPSVRSHHGVDRPVRGQGPCRYFMKVVGAGKEKWPLMKILSKWYRWIHRGNWDSRASVEAPAAHLQFGGHR